MLPFSQPRIFSIRLLIPRRYTCRIELTRTGAGDRAVSPVKRYVVRMGHRAIHGFFSLSRNVRLLWFFALFEALNLGVHLIAR